MADEVPRLDSEIEELIRQINTGGGGGLGREAAKARLEAMHVAVISSKLHSLSEALFSAQRVVGTRLGELNDQMKAMKEELNDSSVASGKHSRALVFWTKWSFAAISVYVLLTGGLFWVSYRQSEFAEKSLQAQAEPEFGIYLNSPPGESEQLVFTNDGKYPLVDIAIDTEIQLFLGPPWNEKVVELGGRMYEQQGRSWWTIDRVGAGERRSQLLGDVGKQALALKNIMDTAKSRGELKGIASAERVGWIPVIRFRILAHREVDHKSYRVELLTVVLEDAKTGKPTVIRADSSLFPFLKQLNIVK
jgi:hypothetical protein